MQLADVDKPIAAAVLLYMRKLALELEKKTHPGASSLHGRRPNIQRRPHWQRPQTQTRCRGGAAQVAKYEAIQIDGSPASSRKTWSWGPRPVWPSCGMLKVSRNFIHAKRSFDAANFVNGSLSGSSASSWWSTWTRIALSPRIPRTHGNLDPCSRWLTPFRRFGGRTPCWGMAMSYTSRSFSSFSSCGQDSAPSSWTTSEPTMRPQLGVCAER